MVYCYNSVEYDSRMGMSGLPISSDKAWSFITLTIENQFMQLINAFQVFDSINVEPVSCAWVTIDIVKNVFCLLQSSPMPYATNIQKDISTF